MGLLKEFKNFAFKGNLIDLAIGVILGTAFGKIVNSIVGNIITPILGFFTPDSTGLKNLKIVLKKNSHADGATNGELAIKYGLFLEEIINFLIIAFIIFMFVKFINKLQNKQEETPQEPPAQEKLLCEIRDLLKKG
jgi:large conductance mechanosensitive channel